MSNKFKLAALSAAVAGSLFSGAAMADLSANVGVSNMYLWRGLNISNPGAEVYGGLDYAHDSGFWAGVWTSSEGWLDNSSETDLYAGYTFSTGDFSATVGYYDYLYPDAEPGRLMDNDVTEAFVGLGYADFGLGAYIGTDGGADYVYYTASYGYEAFGITLGMNDDDDNANDYWHVDLSYAATDELSFTLSQADGKAIPSQQDPLFRVSYTLGFDL